MGLSLGASSLGVSLTSSSSTGNLSDVLGGTIVMGFSSLSAETASTTCEFGTVSTSFGSLRDARWLTGLDSKSFRSVPRRR